MFGLDNLIDMLFDSAMESINRNERIIQVLKRLKLDPDHPPADFTGVYQYALVEYGVGKPRPALAIFRQKEIQDLFREALERNNPSILLKNGEAFLADSPLQSDLQASNIDVRREFYEFAAIFIEVAKRTRTPAEILAEQKLESLHRQLGGLQERLNRLPTIEGLRTEMARLSAQSPLALPGGAEPETFSAEQCKAFALAQQMRGWFETLGFRFETHEVWQDDYFEWIINIPVRRGRYDRILVRGIDGEAGLSAVEDLKQAVATHRTDEGWLVTARRISRAARDEVEKAENEGLGCYTLDELLDQDADFNSYLTWLETEIQQRGIDQKYVPLACLKEEIDPDTQQRLGVSRYGDRDGWIDGYIDLWLDDPAKEHISVLGEFGTGKTWFALHYAWKALQRYREAQRRGLERPRLPLVIPLRDYAKAVSVESLFSEFFFRKHEIPIPGYSAFEQLNRMGKLLLIFDGFDEMAARVDRQEMINNFWELAKVVVPGAKVILTCRTEHFPDAKEGRALLNAELQASTRDLTGETPQFEVLELEKFNDEQIRQVLAHQAQPATVAQIMGNPQLLDLARRPVLTELILEALPDIEAGKPVDMSRVYLYAVRHKMERDIKAERTFTSMADKLYFMCELSWEMLSTDRMSINYREFPDRIRKLFGPAVQEEKDLDHWHYDMMGQTMLIRNADGDYTPAHRSLIEFFVAYKFAAELGTLASDFSEIADISPLIARSDTENFGRQPLSKALQDLVIPMLDHGEKTKERFIQIILKTRTLKTKSNYSSGNSINALLALNNSNLINTDLSDTVIRGADFSHAVLSGTNFRNTEFIESKFIQNFGAIFATSFEHEKCILATGHSNGEVWLWNENYRRVTNWLAHKGMVRSVAFSPDNKILATASYDRTIKLWDVSQITSTLSVDQPYRVLNGHTRGVRSVSFSPDGQYLASGSEDYHVIIWDLENGKPIQKLLLGKLGYMRSVEFTKSGDNIAFTGDDYSIVIWSLNSNKPERILKGHSNWVKTIKFNLEGSHLVSGGQDGNVILWDLNSDNDPIVFSGHNGQVNCVKFSPDGKTLASASADTTVRIWEIESGKCKYVLNEHTTWVQAIDFNPNGDTLVSGGQDNAIKLWNVKNGQCLQTLNGYVDWIEAIKISPDNRYLAVSTQTTSLQKIEIELRDFDTGEIKDFLAGHTNIVSCLTFSPRLNALASGSVDSTVKIWDIEARECIKTFFGHEDVVESLAFNREGNILVTGSEDETIRVWDVDTGQCIRVIHGHIGQVKVVSFTADMERLISISEDNCLKVWSTQDWSLIKTLDGEVNWLKSFCLHPPGNFFSCASYDYIVRLWNLETGELVKYLKGHNAQVKRVKFTHDGKLLATGGDDYDIRVWDVMSGTCLAVLKGHGATCRVIEFTNDDRKIVTADEDGVINIWDANEYTNLATFTRKRPYEGMNITGVKGLTESEKATLEALGAIEN